MTLSTVLAGSVGSAIAKAILKVWLKDQTFLESIGESIADLIGTQTKDAFTQKKAERQFQEIGEKVAQSLTYLFESDGANLDENGKCAVALAVAETLEKSPITAQFVLDRKIDPSELANHLLKTRDNVTRDFSEAETALYERIITETSRSIIDIASQLPGFSERSFAELIKKGDQLLEVSDRILSEVKKIQMGSEQANQGQNAARFETEYRLAIGRKLDELELFGVDFNSNVNRRHRLSVAYVTLDVRQMAKDDSADSAKTKKAEDEDIELMSVDVALKQAKRLLIRGQAGSGKTTLLQWVAVKAAHHGFENALSEWNNFVPFFVRLRDFVDKGLPKPEDFPGSVTPSIANLMPQGWVHEKLKSGNAIILVDGVDEMRESQRSDVRVWLKELCEAFPDCRIIVSSRPTAIEEGWMDAQGFDNAELQPMELADIYSFIDHWHSAVKEQLQDDEEIKQLDGLRENLKLVVRNTPPIRSLATNPLLCAMLCALNRDRRHNLPSDRIELYEACCQMLAERRDKERRVAMQDYPQLSYRQKRPLLEDLAYWLMINGWTVVPRKQAEDRLSKRLANMPSLTQSPSGGEEVMRLFVDRTGLLREPQPNHIDFTHRTFQEFLAAKAALDEGDVGVLIKEAHEDQWREMIVLAAGLASQKIREALITGLIQRGDNEPSFRHSLHLLAVSCLETSVALEPIVMKEVEARLKKLVPPASVGEALGLASAGDLAVPYLQWNDRLYAVEAAACVRALGMISTDAALDGLVTYKGDGRQTVLNALTFVWDSFDRLEFARRIFSGRKYLSLQKISNLEGLQACTKLEQLTIFNGWELRDFGPISNLPNLKRLTLFSNFRLTDLKPLGRTISLEDIYFHSVFNLKDFSPLAELPKLETLTLDTIPKEAIIPDALRKKLRVINPK